MNKKYLHHLLKDQAVMEEMAGQASTLESLNESIDSAQFYELLSQNESAVSSGSLTTAEAIILEKGRPPLLIQDGQWEEPSLTEIRNWLKPTRQALLTAIPKVGRVEILNFQSDYIGTGWMITEDLLITNRHVAKEFGKRVGQTFQFKQDSAIGGEMKVRVDFLREHDRTATAQFAVEEIIYIEEDSAARPDMALVRMNKSSGHLPKPLELDSELISKEQTVAVIGYPAYDTRNDTFVMRNVFKGIYDVKRLCPGKIIGLRGDGKVLEHDASTLGGASGSAVMNLTTGKICGLHFGGEYKVANVCVSAAWLRSRLAELEPLRISGLLAQMEKRLAGTATETEPVPEGAGQPPPPGGGGGAAAAAAGSGGGGGAGEEGRPSGGAGYDPKFLGKKAEWEVPLPVLSSKQEELIAPVKDSQDGLLHYTHFSILMNSERRLPFYTAVNIDGGQLYNFVRGNDRWFLDPRLKNINHQIGEDLYVGNKLDRGHLVRRLDPTWGATRKEAKQAEDDTFFFTNCSPQHSKLNQRTWLSLEEYVLSNANTHDLKVSVFTGPVLAETDRPYRKVLLPEDFWKVVVMVNKHTGTLTATGYLLSQRDHMGDLEFVYGAFKTYQVALSVIEEATGLSFNLSEYDPLTQAESRAERVIEGPEDMML
ncbi:endonuclease G [Prosthecobacter debontii]|uniref:Endonuclease G n=1 Tax=Prosthecobacter debontii TaxID=48467 RepID=A0A1T4XZZ1_9BACT|nr:DNA/RNA non-specific endonuclease [Prosthecobacter debontii]SKA94621.1 endonuclease G [Prosthecobacter debontii]